MPIQARQGRRRCRTRGTAQFLAVSGAGPNGTPSINDFLHVGPQNFDADRLMADPGMSRHHEGRRRRRRPERRRDESTPPDARPGDWWRAGRNSSGASFRRSRRHRRSASGRALLRRRRQPRGVCAAAEPSPAKGLLAVRDLSHFTITASDPMRSNAFYQELFSPRRAGAPGADGAAARCWIGCAVPDVHGWRRCRPRWRERGAAASGEHQPPVHEHGRLQSGSGSQDARGVRDRAATGNTPGPAAPMTSYISLRMENRGGAKEGIAGAALTDPDGLLIQLQDVNRTAADRRLPWRRMSVNTGCAMWRDPFTVAAPVHRTSKIRSVLLQKASPDLLISCSPRREDATKPPA